MSNQKIGFVGLHISDDSRDLIKYHPTAFLLLTQIAMRARWKEGSIITGLNVGESFVGDWKEAGLKSEMAYRHAKKVLKKYGFATFRGTSKGTVATLTGSTIYSLTVKGGTDGGTGEEQARNRRGTTNHNEHNEHNEHGTPSCPQADGAGDKSEKTDPKKKPTETQEFLLKLWKQHPAKGKKRSSKLLVSKAWNAASPKPDMAETLKTHELWCRDEMWTKEHGKFAQGLHLWIAQAKYESDPTEDDDQQQPTPAQIEPTGWRDAFTSCYPNMVCPETWRGVMSHMRDEILEQVEKIK